MTARSESGNVRHLVQAQVTVFQEIKRIELMCRLLRKIFEEYGRALVELDRLEQSCLEKVQRVGQRAAGERLYAEAELYTEVLSAHAKTFDIYRERLTATTVTAIEAIEQLL